jgi:hypothetical protein
MGGETKTTQNVKSDPWAPAQPALKTAIGGALDAYKTTYQGPQVAGMDPNVIAGQNAILGNAGAGTIGNLAGMGANNLGSYLNAGGLNGLQWNATAGMADAAGQFNANSGSAMNALNPYMSGQMRGSNPYLDASIENAMTGASDAVNRQFSAAGRYGSGAHTGALGTTLGKIATDARMNAYNADTQNQLNAINSYGQMAGNNLSGNLSALGAIGGMGQQGFQNTLNGVSGLQTLDQAQNTDAANAMKVGAQRMDYQQQQIDAANSAPWARVGNLAQIAGGIGALGGTQNSVTTQTQSGGMPIVGAALGGLGGIANLAKAGGFAALFSDERLKEDIRPVGKLDDGQKVYAYRYKGEPETQIGLLAQEVEKRKPDAVIEHPSGYKMVDYRKATARAITKRSAA